MTTTKMAAAAAAAAAAALLLACCLLLFAGPAAGWNGEMEVELDGRAMSTSTRVEQRPEAPKAPVERIQPLAGRAQPPAVSQAEPAWYKPIELKLRQWIIPIRPRLNYGLPVIGCLVVGVLALLGRRKLLALRVTLVLPLLLLGAVSVGHYMYFYPVLTNDYFDEYEFYHYYIGAKYAPEVGYTQMYNASIVADAEDGLDYNKAMVRDLTYGLDHESPGVIITTQHEEREPRPYRDVEEVLRDSSAIKARFSEERWAEFVQDINFFQRQLGVARWSGILRDKGYNATPVWGMTGGLLSNAAPTNAEGKVVPPGLQAIALLDPLLIVLALLAIAWAYGPTSAALVAIFLGANYLTMHSPTMKQAFLRLDWITLVLIGAALVKRRWYGAAGVVLAYATMARVFPVIFVVGLAARGLLALLRTRRVQREYLVFAVVFAGTSVALVLASIAYAGGLDVWRGFMEKIGFHNNDISTWRVGFKYIFMQTYDTAPPGVSWWDLKAQLQQYMQDHALAWWSIQAVMLLALLYLVKFLRDDEAIPFSFVAVFFLVAPTHYYYFMLVIPFLFFAGRHTHALHAAGMAYMFALCAAGWHYDALRQWQFPHAFDMSTLLLVLVLYMMLVTWLTGRLEHFEAHPVATPQEDHLALEN
jgi:hypothetical protein